MLKIIAVTILLGFLAGCSSTTLKGSAPVVVGLEIPQSLRRCLAEPDRLEGDFTQRDVAVYIAQLRHARNNCSANLSAVDKILIEQERLALLAQSKN